MAIDLRNEFLLKEGGTPVFQVFDQPAVLISLILKNIYVIAGIILFFFIIIGGLGMILSSGDTEKQKQGSKTITSAIAGFFILFASYWIIRIIEVLTGLHIFEPGI